MSVFALRRGTMAPHAAAPTTDTFTIAANGDDSSGGWSRTGTYPPETAGGDSAYDTFVLTDWVYASRSLGAKFITNNGFLRWDTSSIPDTATITAATLRAYVGGKTDADSRSFSGDWFDYGGGTDTSADWADTGTNAFAAVTIASITNLALNDFTLLNPDANINKTGFTGIRTHVTGGQPTGLNDVYLVAKEHATLAEAQLIVTYTP